MKPTYEQVKEILAYDPETGVLTWIGPTRGRRIKGNAAGNLQSDGYLLIGVLNRYYYAHCVAWLLVTGKWPEWPAEQVDHENGSRADNRWTNLRLATHAQNNYNTQKTKKNTSGFKGVSWHKKSKKWMTHIAYNKKRMHLGLFDTPEEAHGAYLLAAKKYFGEFARAE